MFLKNAKFEFGATNYIYSYNPLTSKPLKPHLNHVFFLQNAHATPKIPSSDAFPERLLNIANCFLIHLRLFLTLFAWARLVLGKLCNVSFGEIGYKRPWLLLCCSVVGIGNKWRHYPMSRLN
ncbi:hypothetical protein L596_012878 [Steinernema carpocapsae]|uniref:Uncharacterized protein n=1 Tax=Steinernema carpocapsae TaxID=34508 RepID=A0A4U5NYQ6_STECR|nr:hypothetical protein L596_012878 [Steinernema carpocapsae]